MSSLDFKMFVEPKDSSGYENIKNCIGFINSKDYDSFRNLDKGEFIYDPEYYLDFDINFKIKGNVFHLEFDTCTSFEQEEILGFLLSIGAGRIETEIFYSQVCEYGYYLNDEECDGYYDVEWRWLPEPHYIDITGMNIAVLGKITGSCCKAVENAEEYFNIVRVEHVNSDTNLVVTCGDVRKEDLEAAEKYGVRVISEKHFLDIS